MNEKKISIEAYRLLAGNLFLRGGKIVFSIFFNIYIWKETKDIQLIAVFNMMILSAHLIGFVIWTYFVRKSYSRGVSAVWFLWLVWGFSFMYFTLEQVKELYIYYGAIFWFFVGMYYSAQNVRIFSATSFKNRGNYQGVRKSLDTLAKMLYPLIIWWVIAFYDIKMALIFWIIVYLCWFLVSNLKDKGAVVSAPLKDFLSIIKRTPTILYALLAAFLYQLSFSIPAIEVLTSILIFNSVWTELHLWVSLSLISVINMILLYIFWRFIDYKHYNTWFIIVNVLYILALLMLLYSESLYTLLLATSFITGAISMSGLIVWVILSNALHTVKDYKKHNSNFSLLKEFCYFFGWILCYVIIYFSWDISPWSLKAFIYIICFTSILTSIILIKVDMHNIEEQAW